MNEEIQPDNHPDYAPSEESEKLGKENSDTENSTNNEPIILSDDLELIMQAL